MAGRHTSRGDTAEGLVTCGAFVRNPDARRLPGPDERSAELNSRRRHDNLLRSRSYEQLPEYTRWEQMTA